ncbi:hypothetical protein HanIR_Chr01g0036351 [Helianthus annuus]|nr:hypothetical protein HanIR_Chr01g0036351 [Helianthus annuus]
MQTKGSRTHIPFTPFVSYYNSDDRSRYSGDDLRGASHTPDTTLLYHYTFIHT